MNNLRKQIYLAVLVTIAVILTGTCYVNAMDKININTASEPTFWDTPKSTS